MYCLKTIHKVMKLLRVEIKENTPYAKTIIFNFTESFQVEIGVKTKKWMVAFFKYGKTRGYKVLNFHKKINTVKIRTKGIYRQQVKKRYEIFCFEISFYRVEKFSKRKAFLYYHRKKYLNPRMGFWERLFFELKRAIKKEIGFWKK